jgi:cell division FtsZ-interacting protein ZapD
MAERAAADLARELENEKRSLQKADADIQAGQERLRGQKDRLNALQAAGQSTTQAERLVGLMADTLLEWDRHRTLIRQRIAYLETRQSAAG